MSCVIAASFARIFYRNAINIGLPILESPQAAAETEAGHVLEVDLERGEVRNLTTGRSYRAAPYPGFMLEIIAAGGLIPYTRRRIESEGG